MDGASGPSGAGGEQGEARRGFGRERRIAGGEKWQKGRLSLVEAII